MRAVDVDMTNENKTCPQGLTYTVVNSIRMCTRSQPAVVAPQSSSQRLVFPTPRSVDELVATSMVHQTGFTNSPPLLGFRMLRV